MKDTNIRITYSTIYIHNSKLQLNKSIFWIRYSYLAWWRCKNKYWTDRLHFKSATLLYL